MFTVEDAKTHVKENREEITESFMNSDVIPNGLKTPNSMFSRIWDSGCWLNHALRESGATDDEVESIGFAHGQRCFGSDPFVVAVKYVNEFVGTGTTEEKPGPELADKICDELGSDT